MKRHHYLGVMILLGFFGCGPSQPSESQSSDKGEEKSDEETGAVVYIPGDYDDVEVTSGASVANDTTGGYLTLPEGVTNSGPSVYVAAAVPPADDAIAKWTIEIPLTVTVSTEDQSRLAIFYHVSKKNGDKYYGILTGDDLVIGEDYVQTTLRGLGNYQPGLLKKSSTSKDVTTDDVILTKQGASVYTNAVALVSDKIFVAFERNYIRTSSDGGASFDELGDDAGLPSNIVRGLHANANDDLAVATGRGVAYSTDAGESFEQITTADGLPSNRVRKVHFHDNTIYAATNEGLAVITAGDVTTVYTTEDGLLDNDAAAVFRADDGTVYVATAKGVSQKASAASEFTSFDEGEGLPASGFQAIYVDSDNRLWVATLSGLFYKDSGSSIFYEASLGESDLINDIYVDDAGNGYAATDLGLQRFTVSGAGAISNAALTDDDDGLPVSAVQNISVGTEVLAATIKGAAKSTDDGESFEALKTE